MKQAPLNAAIAGLLALGLSAAVSAGPVEQPKGRDRKSVV